MSEIDCSWLKIFDTDGNEVNPDAVYQGQTVYLDISEIPDGYILTGWTDLQGNEIETIKVGDRYQATITCGNGFKAHIREQSGEECEVTVSFFPSNVVGLSADVVSGDSKLCNSTLTVSANSANCCYEFETWNNGFLLPDMTVTVTEGLQPYVAYFKKKTFPISVFVNNSNFGTAEADVDSVECGDEINLFAVPNEGYVFDSWSDGDTNPERTIVYDCNIHPTTFTAFFSEIPQYIIEYNENITPSQVSDLGGNILNGDRFTTWQDNFYTRQNYVLEGWSLTPGQNNHIDYFPNTEYTYTFFQNITLYAVWRQNGYYNINYYGDDPNDYTHYYVSDSYAYDAWFSLRTPPSQTGYTFQGWCILQSGTTYDPTDPNNPQPESGNKQMPMYDIDAYAVWEIESSTRYTIRYVANNGTNNDLTITNIQPGQTVYLSDPSSMNFSKVDHTFSDWGDAQVSPTNTYAINYPMVVNNDIILYAQWTPNQQVTVSYDINNGTGTTPSSQTVFYGNSVMLADDSNFSRTDYTFLGWDTDPNVNQAYYSGGQTIPSLTQNIALYAIWQSVPKFRVYYDCGNGTVIPDPNEYNSGDTVTVGSCDACVIPDGCECSGWCTTNGCSGSQSITYVENDTFEITETTTLYLSLECCDITFGMYCDGCNQYAALPSIYYKINPQDNETIIPLNVPIHVGNDWVIDVAINYNNNPFCYFTGWFDVDELSYILPDPIASGCSNWEWEYKLIPPQYVSDILSASQPYTVTSLSNSVFNDEVKYKQNVGVYGEGAFIYNTTTQEMRQLVKRCKDDSEAYEISERCGHTLIAVIECCSATITFDKQNVVEMSFDNSSIQANGTIGIRKGQSFDSNDFTYLQQDYYVTDIIDMSTGESAGDCDCCYIPFPSTGEYDPNDGQMYYYYYEQISESDIPYGVTRVDIYDRKYILGANSPEYVRLIVGQSIIFGRLRRITCSEFELIWNDLANGKISWFYDGEIDNYCNCSIPFDVPTCDNNSANMICCKGVEVALIKHRTNCTYTFDCNKTYRVCISPRDYVAPTHGWKMVNSIPAGTPQNEILDTTSFPSLSWLCFNDLYDPSDLNKVPGNYNYAIANIKGMGGTCTTYWERVEVCP